MGDPYVLLASDGFYYMYGTTEEDGYSAYRSADLANWESLGRVYEGRTKATGPDRVVFISEMNIEDGHLSVTKPILKPEAQSK